MPPRNTWGKFNFHTKINEWKMKPDLSKLVNLISQAKRNGTGIGHCNYRELMLKSALKRSYVVTESSFVVSKTKGKKKLTMDKKEKVEVKTYFAGYATEKVDVYLGLL